VYILLKNGHLAVSPQENSIGPDSRGYTLEGDSWELTIFGIGYS